MDAIQGQFKLLLVDDEEDFLISSSRALSRRGFDVEVAPNGVTALEKVDQLRFDIIVLDVKMPDIDGVEVFRHIKEKHPAVPIVLLTGHSSIEDAFATSKEGIADYLSKPIDMEELAVRLRKIIRQWRPYDSSAGSGGAPLEFEVPIQVMVVDDELDFLSSVKSVLERRGMNVAAVDSGERALARLREALVDVMILDVKMPGMSGLEVLRRIKRSFPSVQVILLSGHPSATTAVDGIKSGASEYLQKPPDMDELAATIRQLHRDRQRALFEEQQRVIEEIRRRYPE